MTSKLKARRIRLHPGLWQ